MQLLGSVGIQNRLQNNPCTAHQEVPKVSDSVVRLCCLTHPHAQKHPPFKVQELSNTVAIQVFKHCRICEELLLTSVSLFGKKVFVVVKNAASVI